MHSRKFPLSRCGCLGWGSHPTSCVCIREGLRETFARKVREKFRKHARRVREAFPNRRQAVTKGGIDRADRASSSPGEVMRGSSESCQSRWRGPVSCLRSGSWPSSCSKRTVLRSLYLGSLVPSLNIQTAHPRLRSCHKKYQWQPPHGLPSPHPSFSVSSLLRVGPASVLWMSISLLPKLTSRSLSCAHFGKSQLSLSLVSSIWPGTD